LIAREIDLPRTNEGDYVIVQDTGSYTLSMWSRYNSRQAPKIVGYFNNGNKFTILKEKETLAQVADIWK